LLDTNVLIALSWPHPLYHAATHSKFSKRFISIELGSETGGGGVEVREVSCFQHPLESNLLPYVKEMAEFVPERPDRAIVHCRWSVDCSMAAANLRRDFCADN
jgi:hypothetical protein